MLKPTCEGINAEPLRRNRGLPLVPSACGGHFQRGYAALRLSGRNRRRLTNGLAHNAIILVANKDDNITDKGDERSE